MYHPRLRGSHYKMGHHYASLIYKHGFRISQLPKLSAKALDFGRRSEKIVSGYFPEILEEIKGFAAGCHGSYDFIVSFLLNIGIEKYQIPKCSAFAAFNGSDVFFGRNHDYSPAFKKFTESCLVSPEGGYSFIGQSDVFIGKCDGVNEKGLAIGTAFVAGKTPKPGVNFEIANRYVLEKCATVQESATALSKFQFSTSQNFLLTDKSGDMAVVEACSERIRIRKPENGGFIVSTNNFLHSDMQKMEQNHDRNWFNSETRYRSIYDVLKQLNGDIDLLTVQRILSGHYGFVCQYDKSTSIDTLWSFASNLKELNILRAEGNPSKTKFKNDSRLSDEIEKRNKTKKNHT